MSLILKATTNPSLYIFITSFIFLNACASEPPRDPRQVRLESEIRNLRAAKKQLQTSAKAYAALEGAMARKSPLIAATFTAKELERAYDKAMPISFSASQLSNYVSGTITVSGIQKIRLDGAKGRFLLIAKGRNIKLNTVVPPGYQTMARELITSLKSGITLSIKGELLLDKNGKVKFKGKCDKVQLKKYNKRKYQNMVRQGVNQSILAREHIIKMEPAQVNGQKLAVRMITKIGKNLVFVYAK